MIKNKRDMLKRKRFHPDETYDSMVVTYSSDDAVKVDPVYGNGKFECALNNTNSITHARKLLPLRAHVPNSYNNVTEGQNTLRYAAELSREFELTSPDNEFDFYYEIEYGPGAVGTTIDIPMFGQQHANPNTTPYNFNGGPTLRRKIIVPEGKYTLQSLSIAIDQAMYDACKADYDFRFSATGEKLLWDMNEWLTHGPNFATGAPTSGYESMNPEYGSPATTKRSFEIESKNDSCNFVLSNTWALSNITGGNVTPTGTWPDHPPVGQPLLANLSFYGGPGIIYPPDYRRKGVKLVLTANQDNIFGLGGALTVHWQPSLELSLPPDSFAFTAVNKRDIAKDYEENTLTFTSYSNTLTITPGYYSAAQLADAIDTVMKASVEVSPWLWLHRIRNYYDGGGQNSDVDLRRCEYDSSANVFKFYFSPVLTDVVSPSNTTDVWTYGGTYGDDLTMVLDKVRIDASPSLLRMLGLGDDHELQLPTDASMTIQQSVNGGCVNMDIPYVYITSPQISRNNVLTSDSRNRNILATIPMTGTPRCEYAHYTGVDIYIDNIEYRGPTSLDRVEFEVTDDKHNVLTIPTHTPVSISLKVYHDDTEP